ncbi:hypothetical protein [Brachybacterium kimchii]|uniref:Uncharacterized protein n=1 Tax=Brachybacterium kimchii TaxID=2942909 RepID=A0ABY4N2W6_9MICO|nr:hypothetical protein [Brachybacterium kimchii]UQN28908.1 hypothetical protein M4486_14930 [Brachybacterium kimchii]
MVETQFVDHAQGTQAKIGTTLVGIMRVGDADGRGVAQLMIRSSHGDLVETAFEGDEVAIPDDGFAVIGAATPPDAENPRWRIALGHRAKREGDPRSTP